MKKQLFKVIFCGMLLFFMGCAINNLPENDITNAINRGNLIIEALEKYKELL